MLEVMVTIVMTLVMVTIVMMLVMVALRVLETMVTLVMDVGNESTAENGVGSDVAASLIVLVVMETMMAASMNQLMIKAPWTNHDG